MKGYGFPDNFVHLLVNLYDEYKSGWVAPVSNEIEEVFSRAFFQRLTRSIFRSLKERQLLSNNMFVIMLIYLFLNQLKFWCWDLLVTLVGKLLEDWLPRKVSMSELQQGTFENTPTSIMNKLYRNPEKADYFRYLGAEPVEWDLNRPHTVEKV